jgi:hypothetical protein
MASTASGSGSLDVPLGSLRYLVVTPMAAGTVSEGGRIRLAAPGRDGRQLSPQSSESGTGSRLSLLPESEAPTRSGPGAAAVPTVTVPVARA